MDIIDISAATPQDRAIIMCIERINALESELYDMRKELLVRDIATAGSVSTIAIDVFMFLLGAPPIERSPTDIQKDIKILYERANSTTQSRLQEFAKLMNNEKNLWEMTAQEICIPMYYDDMFGNNIYSVLQAMTMDELKGIWQYELQKTKRLKPNLL
jgi:hypothetical protein